MSHQANEVRAARAAAPRKPVLDSALARTGPLHDRLRGAACFVKLAAQCLPNHLRKPDLCAMSAIAIGKELALFRKHLSVPPPVVLRRSAARVVLPRCVESPASRSDCRQRRGDGGWPTVK